MTLRGRPAADALRDERSSGACWLSGGRRFDSYGLRPSLFTVSTAVATKLQVWVPGPKFPR
jgi:hypothetical protein